MTDEKESKLKTFFCGWNAVGAFSEFCVRAIAPAEIELEPEEGEKTVKTYCWCCALWRGILIGGVAGLVVGALLW